MARYECPGCSYSYDEVKGHNYEGFPPGTPWSAVPEDWACPECAVRDKADFELISGEKPANLETAPAPQPPAPQPSAPQPPAPQPKVSMPVAPPKSAANAKVAAAKMAPASKPVKPQANRDPYLKWICLTCGHIYDEELGDPFEGVAAGTRFSDVPESWICTDCGTPKEDYILFEEE